MRCRVFTQKSWFSFQCDTDNEQFESENKIVVAEHGDAVNTAADFVASD